MEPGPEECHDTTIVSVIQVPDEVCDLNPVKTCRFVTKLVPHLNPTHECTVVPKEQCVLKFGAPHQVEKPFLTKWCLDPSEPQPGESQEEGRDTENPNFYTGQDPLNSKSKGLNKIPEEFPRKPSSSNTIYTALEAADKNYRASTEQSVGYEEENDSPYTAWDRLERPGEARKHAAAAARGTTGTQPEVLNEPSDEYIEHDLSADNDEFPGKVINSYGAPGKYGAVDIYRAPAIAVGNHGTSVAARDKYGASNTRHQLSPSNNNLAHNAVVNSYGAPDIADDFYRAPSSTKINFEASVMAEDNYKTPNILTENYRMPDTIEDSFGSSNTVADIYGAPNSVIDNNGGPETILENYEAPHTSDSHGAPTAAVDSNEADDSSESSTQIAEQQPSHKPQPQHSSPATKV